MKGDEEAVWANKISSDLVPEGGKVKVIKP